MRFTLLCLLPLSLIAQQTTDVSLPAEPVATAPEEMIELTLHDDTAIQVIELLEELTDKIILRRQDIAPTKINFDTNGPIPKSDAILALESLLTLNGVMLTDMGGRFMKAVPATDVNRHVPQMLHGSTLDMKPSQQIYAKLFKLNFLKSEEVGGTIVSPLLSQNSNFVNFPKSNALLISDALINLQRIEKIINEADTPQSVREEIQFIKLNYVQAREMQERLENLINGPLSSYLEGNTSVTADERTNQMILITHPGNVEMITNVIKGVDVDAAPLTSSEVFPLRQAKAEDVVPIIENIIKGQKEGREEDAKVTRDNASGNRTANNNTAPSDQPAPTPPPAAATASASTEANSSLQFSNFVGLSADERTNAIVAYGTQSDIRTIRELIEKIDVPLPQVLIEAIITQVTLSENQASGLDSIGFSFDGATKTFSDIALGTAGGISITDGIIDIDAPEDFSLSAAISMEDNRDSDARVLSTPRIIVSHNEEGVINVSRSQPIITSTTSSLDSNNNTRSTVEFRDIGIKLTVTPLIGADGTVQMVIEQTIENVAGNVSIDGNDQPIISKREATSTVSVKDGQIIVLAGLQENSVNKGNNYLPLIGRLPLIRNVFGSDTDSFSRTEIIVFIRPRIMKNPSNADALAREYINLATEREAVESYLEKDSTQDLYMEGSRFEDKKRRKAEAKAAKEAAKQEAEAAKENAE